jgi:hypothetical protein|tara:strand:- start:2113 stop:2322 length:210 start_codon:yes stop_codon:yes gene_type:complete
MDEQEILTKFFDIINCEDWNDDVFTGIETEKVLMTQYITIPTPHPEIFINFAFSFEYNPDLGKDLYGET